MDMHAFNEVNCSKHITLNANAKITHTTSRNKENIRERKINSIKMVKSILCMSIEYECE